MKLVLKQFVLTPMTGSRKEIKKVEKIQGNQTKEESKEESEDHLGCSHYHIHFCGEKFSEIFSG